MNILEKNVLLKPSSFHLLFQICSNYQKEIEQSSNICWDSGARRVVLYENHHRVAQPYENHGMQKQFWTRTQISWYAKYPKIEKPSEFQAFFMFFSVFMLSTAFWLSGKYLKWQSANAGSNHRGDKNKWYRSRGTVILVELVILAIHHGSRKHFQMAGILLQNSRQQRD